MKGRSWVVRSLFLLVLLAVAGAAAAEPRFFNYQGRLEMTGGGEPPPFVNVDVFIYKGVGGFPWTMVWSGYYPGVPVENGVFNLRIGEGDPSFTPGPFMTPLAEGENELWFEIFVNGEALGPIQPLGRVPLAMLADVAQNAEMAMDAYALGGLPPDQYALAADLSWGNLSGVPADLLDGDDDTQLSQAQVQGYVAGSVLDLAFGSTVAGQMISTGFHTVDTDTQLSEPEVENYVTNGPLSLDPGTTLGGQAISTGGHTSSLDWAAVTGIPAGFGDGIDDDALGSLSCGEGQVGKWISGAWACAADETGGGGGGGYAGVAIVATSGGDYLLPSAAISDLGAWCGVPSASNPCLIKVMPGVYDDRVLLQDFVSLSGSGRGVTLIQYGGYSYAIDVKNECLIENLTVVQDATGGSSAGTINAFGGISAVHAYLNNVEVVTQGASFSNSAVTLNRSHLEIRDCVFQPSGGQRTYGISAYDATVEADGVRIAAVGGSNTNAGVYLAGNSWGRLSNLSVEVFPTGVQGISLASSGGVSTNNVVLRNSRIEAISSIPGFDYAVNIYTPTSDTNTANNLEIYNSSLKGRILSNHTSTAGTTNIKMANTMIDGYLFNISSTSDCSCAGVYMQDFSQYSSTCTIP